MTRLLDPTVKPFASSDGIQVASAVEPKLNAFPPAAEFVNTASWLPASSTNSASGDCPSPVTARPAVPLPV